MDENQEKEAIENKQEPVTEKQEVIEEKQELVADSKETINQNQDPIAESQETTNQNQDPIAESQEATDQNQNPITEKQNKKGSYITGTIGAILGGLVGAIPWILSYSFANMIIAALAIIIAGGAYFGYKIFKGKIGRGLPAILTIVSLLVVTVVTTIICPTILIARSNYPITLENLKNLYIADARVEVREAIIQDLIISLLFTIGAIALIIRSISVQIRNGAMSKDLKFSTEAAYEEVKKQLKEQSEVVKKACLGLNCMSKEDAVTKQELLNELEMTYNIEYKKAKQYFLNCLSNKLLKKYKGKYYYDETDEILKIENIRNQSTRRVYPIVITIIIIAILVGIIVACIMPQINKDNKDEYYTVEGTEIQIKADDSQLLYRTKEEILSEFGEEAAQYYDFLVLDKAEKYELYGQVIPKTSYTGVNFEEIIQKERDYYAPYFGEDVTSEVLDKNFGESTLKSYNYTYEGTDGNQYRAVIYLYEAQLSYLWINVYVDIGVELTQVDTIVDNLLK